ncbi:hypothetical protein MFFC18_49940 [Mariniblastus fucicola]|uniref:Uncharacterized protein n=1 Tax=Mariniblastus fucicola TaxID=980251 RepID=A0A5B9PRD5_9BACT|nr:hypothetical protein MFFC18_49940 [Mariniblastus fucicola]
MAGFCGEQQAQRVRTNSVELAKAHNICLFPPAVIINFTVRSGNKQTKSPRTGGLHFENLFGVSNLGNQQHFAGGSLQLPTGRNGG